MRLFEPAVLFSNDGRCVLNPTVWRRLASRSLWLLNVGTLAQVVELTSSAGSCVFTVRKGMSSGMMGMRGLQLAAGELCCSLSF